MTAAIAEPTLERTSRRMRERLAGVVPEIELAYKAELVFEINRLKVERRAVILGHNYMEPALYHTVADHVGDSLELSRIAARSDAEIIVFCGVRFMAETAKILNPGKTVLLPSLEAGCSLAASITAKDVRELRRQYPGAPVVSYVNTYAEVKAESDACCTSSNAAAVIASFDSDTVIFVPDEFLARNVAAETGKPIVFPPSPARLEGTSTARSKGASSVRSVAISAGKSEAMSPARSGVRLHAAPSPAARSVDSFKDRAALVGWPGRCEVHEKFTVADVENVRRQFPDVVVLAHPECSPEVVAAADFSGSTSAMIRYVQCSEAPRYLLLTECAMGDNIAAENPEKEMVRLCSVRCPHMNRITLEETLAALRETRYVIDVPEPTCSRARRAVERMLAVGPTAARD